MNNAKPSENFASVSPLFSEGANNAIVLLNPGKRPSGSAVFPARGDWGDTDLRIASNETLRDWFRRIIGAEAQADARIRSCGIEANIAFFARVSWTETGINFCRLQILLIEDGDLKDFYCDASFKGIYYRCEADLSSPGQIFKEPLPHVHCVADGAPRFPLMYSRSEYLPITFLEFIYLNHLHEHWLAWAKTVISKRGGTLPFEGIVEHFKTGTISSKLEIFNEDLTRLKETLSAAKRECAPNPPGLNTSADLLNYWCIGRD